MLFLTYTKQVFEVKKQILQVPGMLEELQFCTNYSQQTIQEPVKVMMPQIQTVNSIQQIQEDVKYTLTPICPHIVPSPTVLHVAGCSPDLCGRLLRCAPRQSIQM